MGQKTHPRGFRLGIVAPWKSRWYAERNFPKLLVEDETIRKYLHQRLGHASIAEVEIERKPGKTIVTLHTARPGVVIGKGGSEVDKLRDELSRLSPGNEVAINVEEVKRPEVDAQLVADSIAHQIVPAGVGSPACGRRIAAGDDDENLTGKLRQEPVA